MKERLKRLRLTSKLLVSPVTALLLLVVFGAVTYATLSRQQAALDDIFKNRFERQNAVKSAILDYARIHTDFKDVMNSGRELAEITKRRESLSSSDGSIAAPASGQGSQVVRESRQRILKALEEANAVVRQLSKSVGLGKEEAENLSGAVKKSDNYAAAMGRMVAELNKDDISAATAALSDADQAYSGLIQDLYLLSHLEAKLTETQYTSAYMSHRIGLGVLAGVFIAAVVLSIFIAMIMRNLILTPIARTIEGIEEMAGGDLTKRIDVNASDEIGEMVKHFNTFADRLRDAITQVAGSSEEVSSAAIILEKATEQMVVGANQTAVQINSVAAASEEMSKTSAEIAQSCVAAVRSSELAGDSAKTGGAIIESTTAVMDRINQRVKESATIIRNLGTRSEQIGQIVGLINDVADQTNLLALNAAIEAARAGEHGRGFAVVADEVRKLAERTGLATKEISSTVHAMQEETKEAVASMEEGVADVEVGTKEAARSGDALKEIFFQVNRVTGEINQIAVASEEETATTNEIASSIQQISDVMKGTSHMIQENSNASSRLANLSKDLQSMVGQFKLHEVEEQSETAASGSDMVAVAPVGLL